MRRLPHDVQRDMTFYRAVVDFRNAVERMMVSRGRPLDVDHVWWGFGYTGWQRHRPTGDGGLAGSRVPRRPHGGSGGARVQIDEPIESDPG
jgi:hypothetical protein